MTGWDLPGQGIMTAMSPCLGCGLTFIYDPDRVPSIRFVHRVQNSLELALAELPGSHAAGEHGGPLASCASCQEVARLLTAEAVTEPICPRCCAAANPIRAAAGLSLLPVTDSLDPGWMS